MVEWKLIMFQEMTVMFHGLVTELRVPTGSELGSRLCLLGVLFSVFSVVCCGTFHGACVCCGTFHGASVCSDTFHGAGDGLMICTPGLIIFRCG